MNTVIIGNCSVRGEIPPTRTQSLYLRYQKMGMQKKTIASFAEKRA